MALWGFHENWQPVRIFYVVELTSGVSQDYCTDNDDLPGQMRCRITVLTPGNMQFPRRTDYQLHLVRSLSVS